MIKKLDGKKMFSGKIIDLYLDDVEIDGVRCTREYVRHRGGVAILAEKDGKFAFVRQNRYPLGADMLELPAGKREIGEAPEITAARELEEECGVVAEKLYPICKFAVSPGYTDEIIYLYYANEFKKGVVHLDEDEFLTCEWIDKKKVYKMVENGEIYDGKTLIALYKYRAGLVKAE